MDSSESAACFLGFLTLLEATEDGLAEFSWSFASVLTGDVFYSFFWIIDSEKMHAGNFRPKLVNMRAWGNTQSLSALRLTFDTGCEQVESGTIGVT